VREAATICPAPCKLIFNLLILKVVSESRVTLATSVPILVSLGLSVLDLGPMYATDGQTDVRRTSSLNAPYPRGGGIKWAHIRRCDRFQLYRGEQNDGASLTWSAGDCGGESLQSVAAVRHQSDVHRVDGRAHVERRLRAAVLADQRVTRQLPVTNLHAETQQQTISPVASVESRRRLRSVSSADLIVPATRWSTLGDRAFAVAGPRAWNNRPIFVTGHFQTLIQDSSFSAEFLHSVRQTTVTVYSALEVTLCYLRHSTN